MTRTTVPATLACATLLTVGGGLATGSAAPAPAATAPGQPHRSHLVTAGDLAPLARPGRPVGRAVDRPAGTPRATDSLCGWPAGLGQQSLLARDFAGIEATELVLGFSSPAAATRARARILDGYRHCVVDTDTNSTIGAVDGNLPVRRPSAASRTTPVVATAASAMRRGTGARQARFEQATVVQVDNRVAWLIGRSVGEDDNCATLPGDEVVGQCGTFAAAQRVTDRLAGR